MERIQRALERARSEKRRHAGITAPAPHRVPEQDIRYTQTRVQEVAHDHLHEQRVVSAFLPGAYTEAYRMLRTQVLQRLREEHWNTLAITSAADGEGKSLTAANLAISLASEVTCTVLLVDADLRRPSLRDTFGLQSETGLSDYLTGATDDIGSMLVHPAGIERLVLLPGGRPQPDSAELLSSPRMLKLVEELRHRYPSRIVLFDLPPVLSTADAQAFAPYVESALLVVEEGRSRADHVMRAAELLQKTRLIGTVLNRSYTGRETKPNLLLASANKFLRRVPDHPWARRATDALVAVFNRLRRKRS